MKKILCLLITLMLFFTGCNQNEESSTLKKEDTTKLKSDIDTVITENKELKEANINLREEINSLKTEFENYKNEAYITHSQINRNFNYIKELSEFRIVQGYITQFDQSSNVLNLDKIEWITLEEESRINELGLNKDRDFPNGFYILNQNIKEEQYKITNNTHFYILDSVTSTHVTKQEFLKKIKEYKGNKVLFSITIINNKVIEISQLYTP